MKRMNIALILNLIREKGTISRVDLAKETGLTAATVTNLTAELIDNKLVEEFSTGVSTGGRKPVLLKINSGEFCVVMEKEIKYLSIGISNIINIFNPGLIVLSSNIINFDIAVINRLSEEIKKSSVAGERYDTNLSYSSLGNRALLNGATALVLSRVYENPRMLWDNKEE